MDRPDVPTPAWFSTTAASPWPSNRLLLEALGNAIMRELTAFMHALVKIQLRNDKFTPERARLGLRQHVGIMEAILAGDRMPANVC